MLNKINLDKILILSALSALSVMMNPLLKGCNYIITPQSSAGQSTVTTSSFANPDDYKKHPVADHLVLTSGNSQPGYPGAPLSQSLRVQVQDQYNHPALGAN